VPSHVRLRISRALLIAKKKEKDRVMQCTLNLNMKILAMTLCLLKDFLFVSLLFLISYHSSEVRANNADAQKSILLTVPL
jgi:hypothetical protein